MRRYIDTRRVDMFFHFSIYISLFQILTNTRMSIVFSLWVLFPLMIYSFHYFRLTRPCWVNEGTDWLSSSLHTFLYFVFSIISLRRWMIFSWSLILTLALIINSLRYFWFLHGARFSFEDIDAIRQFQNFWICILIDKRSVIVPYDWRRAMLVEILPVYLYFTPLTTQSSFNFFSQSLFDACISFTDATEHTRRLNTIIASRAKCTDRPASCSTTIPPP
jgi:hypothetical protein